MKFKASYNSAIGPDGKLKTVGVLLMGSKGLTFISFPGMSSFQKETQQDLDNALLHMEPSTVFDYMVESGNGITTEWSEPFAAHGEAPEAVGAALLDGLKSR